MAKNHAKQLLYSNNNNNNKETDSCETALCYFGNSILCINSVFNI